MKTKNLNKVWSTKKPVNGGFPIGTLAIKFTTDGKEIILHKRVNKTDWTTRIYDKKEARSLAKLILKALEETK